MLTSSSDLPGFPGSAVAAAAAVAVSGDSHGFVNSASAMNSLIYGNGSSNLTAGAYPPAATAPHHHHHHHHSHHHGSAAAAAAAAAASFAYHPTHAGYTTANGHHTHFSSNTPYSLGTSHSVNPMSHPHSDFFIRTGQW